MKVSLRSKIHLAILPLLILSVGLTFYVILNLRFISHTTESIASAGVDLSQTISKATYSLAQAAALVNEHWIERDDPKPEELARLSKQMHQTADDLNDIFNTTTLDEARSEVLLLSSDLRDTNRKATQLASGAGDPNELVSLLLERQRQANELQNRISLHIAETSGQLQNRFIPSYIILVSGMVCSIVLTLFISTILWKRILRPIEEITEGMRQLGSDDLSIHLTYRGNDELGRLAQTFEKMAHRLAAYRRLSDQKLLRSTSALRKILDHSPDAFFLISRDLHATYSSPRGQELLQSNEFDGQFPDKIKDIFRHTLDTHEPMFSKELKSAIQLKINGEDRWMLIHSFPFDVPTASASFNESDMEPESLAAVFQDVTLLKLSDRLRSNLIATVSHELKTPLTSARMSLYLLLEGQVGPLNADQTDLLETARDDLNRQLATIQNLLDLSRIEDAANRISISEFDLVGLVNASIRTHREISESHGVRLSWDAPESSILIEGDQHRLGIVLNNFVVNAIKYSGTGTTARIVIETFDQTCRVSVKDEGPGMSEEATRSVFSAYVRGNELNKVEGSGLGLSIAKEIVEAHHGQIGCTSRIDEGSCFFFEIPIRQIYKEEASI